MEEKAETKRASMIALTMSTLAFTACFACWVINAVLATWLRDAGVLKMTSTELGWLLALPIFTGAISRVPLGLLTDRFGGRVIFPLVMGFVSLSLLLLSMASTYQHFLFASLGFGVAGGSFAVGIGFTSVWFEKQRQGTALGIFGAGNAGAALTTAIAPQLLDWFTHRGANIEAWRMLPRSYAALLALIAILFFIAVKNRTPPTTRSLSEQLAPLKSIVVWRFGLYYFLVFGGFVAFAQWLVPYSLNVYPIGLKEAGLLAAAFSLPSGLVRALGGWMSDRYGPKVVMYGVFAACIACALLLSIPKMQVISPGKGILAMLNARQATVRAVTSEYIQVGTQRFALRPPPKKLPAQLDQGGFFWPQVSTWHEPIVKVGETVQKKQLLARGISNIYYPSNIWFFVCLVVLFGFATGIGTAAVYKFIPDYFPHAVGAVGGMVGLIGAMGGFILPPVFGALLRWTGLWSSCWIVLLVLSIVCLAWMLLVVRQLMQQEAPILSQLIEHRAWASYTETTASLDHNEAKVVEEVLQRLPFFEALSQEELKNIAGTGQWISLGPSQVIFNEGDPGDALYIILKGSVRIHRTTEKGDQIDIANASVGAFVGELSLLDGEPRSADVTTCEPCDFFIVSRREFLSLLSRSPHMLSHVLSGMSQSIRKTNKQLATQGQASATA